MSFLRKFSFPRAFQSAFPKLKYFSSVQTGNWNSFQQKFYQFKRFQSSSKPLLLLENDKENPKVKILKVTNNSSSLIFFFLFLIKHFLHLLKILKV